MKGTNFCSIDDLKILSFFTANCVNPLFSPRRSAWEFKERNFLSCGRLLSFLIAFRDTTTRNHIEKRRTERLQNTYSMDSKDALSKQTRGLTSLAFAQLDPVLPSGLPYLHSVYDIHLHLVTPVGWIYDTRWNTPVPKPNLGLRLTWVKF